MGRLQSLSNNSLGTTSFGSETVGATTKQNNNKSTQKNTKHLWVHGFESRFETRRGVGIGNPGTCSRVSR